MNLPAATPPDRLLWALQERAKELNCLYQVEELLGRLDAPVGELLPAIIRVIPPGWQYPDVCRAAIELEGVRYADAGFVETPWSQSAPITVQDRVVGRVSVYYTQEMPAADEGPFLKEETRLVRTIAERLGHFIQHGKLRALFQEARGQAGGAEEWRAAVGLLRGADRDLFLRLARKMANAMCLEGIPDAVALLQEISEARGPGAGAEDENQPLPRQSDAAEPDAADRVFVLAGSQYAGAEIIERIRRWVQEDRAGFLMKAVTNAATSPAEIADAIRRYMRLAEQGAQLSPAASGAIRVALIRRFLSNELDYINVAQEVVDLEQILHLIEHMVATPGSHGRIGGKAAGMFLAHRVTATAPELAAIRIPRTWHIASDGLIAFIRHNNLEEVYEQKYKPIDAVRREYPHIVHLFKSSRMPPEILKGLSVALDELGETPIVVRSSSLLEDRLGSAFSGKYKSLFLANLGSKKERLEALADAVAEVYASVFSPDPIQYRADRGLLNFHEEMGVMIQQVVGRRFGRYFGPAYAGVAFSRNELKWSPRIRREDGLVRLVPGLGTRAVDRLVDEYPVLMAPGQPGLRVNVTPREIAHYSPHRADLIDLEKGRLETVRVEELLRDPEIEFPAAQHVFSLIDEDGLHPFVRHRAGEPVVTFDGLLTRSSFVSQLRSTLDILKKRIGSAVDIEFASDGETLYLLQCRPQSAASEAAAQAIPRGIPSERVVFAANRHVTNGSVPELTHIVFVDPDEYARLETSEQMLAVGRAVGRLNQLLPRRSFVLIGPGRWGARGDLRLGVHVTYSEICNSALLMEVASPASTPDLSFGTHFFQDLVESSIRYLPLYPSEPGQILNRDYLLESANMLAALLPEESALERVLRVIDVRRTSGGKILRVVMDGDHDEALGFVDVPEAV